MGRTKGAVNKHKKEKQAKEQHHGIKQRGRPKGSIKQKQEQHQIVNVNINTRKSKSSDEDNEKKKTSRRSATRKEKTLQNMIPNIIFNPSIAIPQGAPINRQETNPPFYDMNSLLQPERLSQLVKTPTPQIVQQIQPLTTNIATSQDKIKEESLRFDAYASNIKPTTEANVDNEQYTPNPQTDQSHPLIIPDLVMNSNVTTPMHNKHIQHKQIVQQVTPQVPKEVKPKYNDTEGLGHKIPIQRIGEIATAIGAGALTGGVTAAGEALLTGGLGALTAEGITGSAIGGGVGAGVYNALGNTGEIGHIVSGIAGAVAGRAAGRAASRRTTRPRPRTARTQENHPLLFRGDGNTTGGSRSGRSRLIEPEIQETHNPTTGESTTWVIPNREEQTIMNRIRRTANRTMRTAAETASNMSNQILDAGRTGIDNIRSQISDASENIIRRVRGRPRLASRVPRSDEEGWNLYSRNDEIGRDINAASRIKAAIKRNKQKTLGHIRWDNEMAQNEQNREAANKLTAALKRTKQQINYEQDVMMHKEIKAKNDKMSKDILNDIVNSSVHHSDARQKAAATLQAALKRARPAPKLLKEHYKKLDKSDKATANFQNLTQHLGDVEQYGKQQDIVEGHRAKLKNIDNFEKLVTNKIKTANMVASKKDVIEGKAAEILQAMSRRRIEKGLTNKRMENAGDILSAVKKERAANRVKANAKTKLTYQFKDAKANHDVKKTGQPLVVLKGTEGPNPTLISQANHKRGLKAAETRKMNAEIEKEAQMLNEKYKNIMKKPSNYKGKNRFNPL